MIQLLRNRNYLFLWLVNIITTFGLELFSVTVLVAIFEETGSTLQATGAMVARLIPSLFLGPIAGVLVDRFRRKWVVIWMDVARLILVGGAVWLLQNETQTPVIPIYIVMVGLSAADIFHRPARLALIPSIVKQDELVEANSFIMVSTQIMMAISFALGGWLILNFSLAQISFWVTVSFLLAIIVGLLISTERRKVRGEKELEESVWQSFMSGWRYLADHPIARPLTVMETLEHVPHGIWTGAIMLAFITQALDGNSTDWGYVVTTYFAGMIVGSILALTISKWLARFPGWIIVINACLSGLMTFGFAYSPTVFVAAAWGLVFGPPMALRDVAQDSLLQSTVAEDQLGRVYAAREMTRSVVFMFSGIFFAWLVGFYPIRTVYAIGGVLYVLTGIYALSNRPLRESKMQEAQ